MAIEFTQDPETGAKYIWLKESSDEERIGCVARTISLRDVIDYGEGPELIVDIGHDGELLGIEIY